MFPVLIKSKLIFLYWGCYWFFQWNWIGKLIKLLSFLTSLIDVLYFSFSFTLNSSSFVFHDFIFMFIYTSFTAFGLKFLFIYYYLLFLFTSYSLFGIISTFFFSLHKGHYHPHHVLSQTYFTICSIVPDCTFSFSMISDKCLEQTFFPLSQFCFPQGKNQYH